MQYAKETRRRERWYDDACGTAFALELLGERWALLIVRELLFGPRRFGELRASLPRITAKVLTDRLESLEAAGIAIRRKLPPSASVQVYELTPWGYRSERSIQELGRWATESPDHDPTLPLSAAALMLSLRTMFAADRASGWEATIGFRSGVEAFVARLDADGLTIRRGEPDGADVIVTSHPPVFAAVVYAGLPLAAAEADGSLSIAGDRGAAERFVTLFPMPADRRQVR